MLESQGKGEIVGGWDAVIAGLEARQDLTDQGRVAIDAGLRECRGRLEMLEGDFKVVMKAEAKAAAKAKAMAKARDLL